MVGLRTYFQIFAVVAIASYTECYANNETDSEKITGGAKSQRLYLDNSTLAMYQFSFCLYFNQSSEKTCTSGNFTSLPQETRNVLWNKLFDEEAGYSNTTQNNDSNETFSSSTVIIGTIFGTTVFMTNFAIIYYCRRRLRNMKKRSAGIFIPNIGRDTDTKKDLPYKTSEKKENEIKELKQENLLNYIASNNSTDAVYNTDDIFRVSSFLERVEEIDNEKYGKKDEIHAVKCVSDEQFHKNKLKTTKTNVVNNRSKNIGIVQINAEKVRCITDNTAFDPGDTKCEIVHVRSPVETSRREDDQPENEIVPTEGNNSREESNLCIDYTRYNWDKIFVYLAKELIDPTKYFLFFNILLAEAGCENPEVRVKAIQEENKGDILSTIFRLFLLWKQGVGADINPKYIENVLGSLNMQTSLELFKSYMREPPLKENSRWQEPSDEACVKKLRGFNDQLPAISKGQIQVPELTEGSVSFSDEITVHHSNGIHILRRRQQVVRKSPSKRRLKGTNVRNRKKKNKYNSKKFRRSASFVKSSPAADQSINCCATNTESDHGQSCDETSQSKHDQHCLKRRVQNEKHNTSSTSSSSNGSLLYDTGNSIGQQHNNPREYTRKSETVNIAEEINEPTVSISDSGYGSSFCDTSNSVGLSEQRSTQEQKILTNEAVHKGGESQLTGKVMNGREQTTVLPQTIELQGNCHVQATSSCWNVSPASSRISNPPNTSTKKNRKRHNSNSDGCVYQYPSKTKKKRVENCSCWRKQLKGSRPSEFLQSHSVELKENNLESKVSVDKVVYNIYIKDLIFRLTGPNEQDIVRLLLESFKNADYYRNAKGEVIRIIDSPKHVISLREKEWTSLKTYVENVRKGMLKETPSDEKTDFLFLCYDGKPLAHEW